MKYWHRISLKPEGRHTVELRHFLNMPEVYYVCRCKIVIRHLTKRLSSLDVDRYSVAYPQTLIIEGCHIEPSGVWTWLDICHVVIEGIACYMPEALHMPD